MPRDLVERAMAGDLEAFTELARLSTDRLYAIDRGEIIFQGNPDAAMANEEVMRTLRG